MNQMKLIGFAMRRMGLVCLLLTGMLLMGCSSAPEPQPEPSKKEIQQDSDRFFEKMDKEEKQSQYSE
jgi:outer membrane biogenesis lipoprotein LolB